MPVLSSNGSASKATQRSICVVLRRSSELCLPFTLNNSQRSIVLFAKPYGLSIAGPGTTFGLKTTGYLFFTTTGLVGVFVERFPDARPFVDLTREAATDLRGVEVAENI